MSQSGLLELAHEKLYWPSPSQIWQPSGAGPSIYARLAQEKLERTIRNLPDGAGVQVGVLAANPNGDETEAPIAVVCDFSTSVSEATLRETYKLAWSFSRSPSLITSEPDRLRVWTCYQEPPTESDSLTPVDEVSRRDLESLGQASLSQQAAETLRLHWADLVSGQFFQEHKERFQRSHSADQLLLSNLKSVRQQLKRLELDYDTIHDLLARIIFIQFLFDRKDSQGNPALNAEFLAHLHEIGELSARYCNLPGILRNHRDTYRFFRWLNDKFNGNLFPGKGATEDEREAEWKAEERKVTQRHLDLLAEFVSGELEMEAGQRCFWSDYSFDVIPIDFISSVYEQLLRENTAKQSIHYTPGHLVDFILDGVLPWNDENWDLKILDPACGSGIFLVKSFQRLIYRWKKAHLNEEIKIEILQNLLERNLIGIDINCQAVRLASLSLYLTMCDEIVHRQQWSNIRFPRLQGRRLIAGDFFQEDIEGFRTGADSAKYDLVVGQAPCGRNSVTPLARSWAEQSNWEITYGNIAPLFLPKAAALTKQNGKISMLQSVSIIILNQVRTARSLLEKLLSNFKIEEIVNLSTMRFIEFLEKEESLKQYEWFYGLPPCIITMCPIPPNGEPLSYICPTKLAHTHQDDYRIVIEPHEINIIYPQEAIAEPRVWTILMWGGRRDLALIRRLSQQKSIAKLKDSSIPVVFYQGIIRGSRKNRYEEILGKRILEDQQFNNTFIYLQKNNLPFNQDPYAERPRISNPAAFEIPQLIIRQIWQPKNQRFKAILLESDDRNDEGVLCSEKYISVNVPEPFISVLESAFLSYNSKLAVYYLLLTSGRFASYFPRPTVEDLVSIPIPEPYSGLLQNLETFDDVDQHVRQAFSFKDSEWVLIEDLFNYTLPDFKGDASSAGRQKTYRRVEGQPEDSIEPELKAYCEYFLRVIKAGFGQDKNVCATIFQEQSTTHLPVRLVAIYLNRPGCEGVQVEPIDSPELLKRLERLNQLLLERGNSEDGGIFYQRVAKVYDSVQWDRLTVPTIYLIKPDKIRYWTRSMALRDADEVAADIMMWRTELDRESEVMEKSYRG